MKKGSGDIRSLAVRNVLEGKYSVAQVAKMTGYCIATIYNWISIYKKEKRLTAKPAGHRLPVFSQSVFPKRTRAGKSTDRRKTRHHPGGTQGASQQKMLY